MPQNLNAWELYQRGLWHLYQFTLDEMREARRLFERAVELDAEFPAIHSGLGYVLLQEWMYTNSGDRATIINRALEAAQTAVALDNYDAFAHFVLCRTLSERGEHEAAIAEGEKAIELDPCYPQAYFGAGDALMHLGRYEESLEMFRTAEQLGPRDPDYWVFVHHQAWPLLMLDRLDEIIEVERRALLSPNASHWPYLPLISALGHLGRKAEASEAIDQLHRLQPDYTCGTALRVLSVDGDFLSTIVDGMRKAGLPE